MRKSEKPLRKICVRLFEEDLETIEKFFPTGDINKALRTIVRAAAQKLRESASKEGVTG